MSICAFTCWVLQNQTSQRPSFVGSTAWKELRVTPVSSIDNLADIGTKKFPVSTMHLLMHDMDIYDSEKGQLVGQDEHEQKLCKQNLRLITGSSN